jgi:multidrug efflux pump subunit AcrA (membrane-fusion protein)
VKVRILNPDDKLMPDMSCKVTFLAKSSTPSEGVQVPGLAVVKQGESPVIFVLDGDVARQRNVTIGKTHDKMVEIASGVRAGEKVLLSRQPLVDGQSVHCHVQ